MVQLTTFDPVGEFQRKRAGALSLRAAEQDLARAPQRNQLEDLKLQQAQQTVGSGRATAARQETEFGQEQSIQRATILGQSAEALLGLPFEQRGAALAAIEPELERFGIPIGSFTAEQLTDENLTRALAQSQAFIGSGGDEASFTLSPGQRRFQDGREVAAVPAKEEAFTLAPGEQRIVGGQVVATGAAIAPPQIDPALLTGLSDEVARKASAAFSSAGGGKDGIKAAAAQIDKATEQERRIASPQLLKLNFPSASPAELNQLQATMDAAKNTESGLKSAEKVRTEQRRVKKAQTFQTRAVELMDRILASDQLGDVLGSIEGKIDVRLFSDAEAELIADIDETGNILTADNLDLMSGVLSESDIKILKNLAGGALTRTRSEDRFVKDLTALRDRLSTTLVQTVDDTERDRTPQTQAEPPSGRQGGTLMGDAQGNRAFVFPDGTVEEVQ